MALRRPVILCILDGWGMRDHAEDNAIALAHTPQWDALLASAPHTTLNASEHFVGLPKGQMGNSEVGHMNIGSGRPVRQLLPRINEAIEQDALRDREALVAYVDALKASAGTCHLIGLCSNGGVHAHSDHIERLARIVAEEGVQVALHLFTDGRDTAPTSARDEGFIAQMQALADTSPLIRIATLGGRHFGMDRDLNWGRVERAYRAIVEGIGFEALSAQAGLEAGYARGETDEFIQPTVMEGYEGMQPHDGVLCANFRPDRARQIMAALTMEEFDGFARPLIVAHALGMADYWSEDCPLTIPAIFPMEQVSQTLGEVLSARGLRQLRIAETEKFNHVGYFFSGGNATFAGEDRVLVPSPKVTTYDLQPEMSAPEVTDKLVTAIASGAYDFIVVNYANPDMVGHTGNIEAATRAIEAVDVCLGRLREAVREAGGVLMVTADHGNADQMRNAKGNPHTQHTLSPVPLVVDGAGLAALESGGRLADIAPTVLTIMGISQPQEMTGTSLVVHDAT